MFNPFNWYWSTPQGIYSSARNAIVEPTDTTYETWIASGNTATPAASITEVLQIVIFQTGVLDSTDTTMHRIAEAVSLGLNSWTSDDIVAFVQYRRALRAIVDGADTASVAIPSKPPYPSGT